MNGPAEKSGTVIVLNEVGCDGQERQHADAEGGSEGIAAWRTGPAV
jgi:hypothetical protein